MASENSEVDSTEGEYAKVEITGLSADLEFLRLLKFKMVESNVSEEGDEEEEEEEEDEEEDDEEEEEEEVKDSCESDQQWDVDSFEGVEYVSDEEDQDLEFRRYVRQCYKSEGFDIDVDVDADIGSHPKSTTRICSGFNNVELDEYFGKPPLTGRMYMEKMVKVIIDKFNDSQQEKKLVFVDIVRSVVKMAVGVKAYITFMAKETPDGEPVEYQGKAEWKVWQKNIHPILCRRASDQRQRD